MQALFDKTIFQKKRNTSVRTENRTELFRKILSQEEIDLCELEQLCFEGIPEDNTIKATCWKILLGYLPLKTTEWKSHLQQQRNLYEFYINLLFQNPETYNNGKPYNPYNPCDNITQSKTPVTEPISRPYSARPAKTQFSDYVTHSTAIQPKKTYFQDDTPQCNTHTKPSKKISFFEDSDDERIKPKPGIFDSDIDTDHDDILGIVEKKEDNDRDVTTPVPTETNAVLSEILDTSKHKKGIKQNENETETEKDDIMPLNSTENNTDKTHNKQQSSHEIEFMTPSQSQNNAPFIPNHILNDPLLKDLTDDTNSCDDPLKSSDKSDKKHTVSFDDKTPKIFSESTETSEFSTPKHQKQDSKILINGKAISNPSKSRKKSDNIKPLDFKPTDTPDPLAQMPNNPWKTYFDDWEIWNRIKKDIHRTHQTYAFFRSNHMICDNSQSKKYRFPFDIATEPPPPITPSMSSANPTVDTPNFPSLDKAKTSQHRKVDSAPLLAMPKNTKIIKPQHKGSTSSYDSMTSSADEEEDTDVENSEDNAPEMDTTDEKKEDTTDNTPKRVSLLLDGVDEIISDIESIEEEPDEMHPIPMNGQHESHTNGDLPPPAPKNIKFAKTVPHKADSKDGNVVSINTHSDPNKKARIERYVMDSKEHGIHAQVMIRILCVYARLNKGVEYVQGMNELLAPIYYIFNMDPSENNRYAEADSFFCFMNLMSYLADRFIAESDHSQLGIIAVVNEFDALLHRVDFELWSLLKKQDLDSKFYALRWLMLLMAMEFQLPEVLRLWDSFLSDHNRFEFVTYFAIAMMDKVRPQLMQGNFAENLQLLQKYPSFDLYELLLPAIEFRNKFPANKQRKKKKKRKKNERNSLRNKHKKNTLSVGNNRNKSKSKSRSPNRSPREIFRNGQSSAKDLFGNILRPQSTRAATRNVRASTNVQRPNPASNIFRSKSPNSASRGQPNALHKQQTFSFGSWKKKWGAK